jgi:hypothetical protein
MGDPTSSYATTGIALRVLGALKPHHHDKVETPLVRYENSIKIHFKEIECECLEWIKIS